MFFWNVSRRIHFPRVKKELKDIYTTLFSHGSIIATIISTTKSCVWLIRVPPVLGAIAVVPIMMMHDPRRGQSEGTHHLPTTSYIKDLRVIKRNRSFIWSTLGLACVKFMSCSFLFLVPKSIVLAKNISLTE